VPRGIELAVGASEADPRIALEASSTTKIVGVAKPGVIPIKGAVHAKALSRRTTAHAPISAAWPAGRAGRGALDRNGAAR
jgi:hypothetical protein